MGVKKVSSEKKLVEKTRVSKENQKKVSFYRRFFYFKGFFGNLVGKVQISDTRLNWLSIIFLVIFDIFIFINLVNGLDAQRNNIDRPSERYDFRCHDTFQIDSDGFTYNQLLTLENYRDIPHRTKNQNAPFYKEVSSRQPSATFCASVKEQILSIQKDKSFRETMSLIKNLKNLQYTYQNEKSTYEQNYREFREDYKAGLGEYNDRISGINNENVRAEYNTILSNIRSNDIQIDSHIASLNNSSGINKLKNYISQNKQEYDDERSKYLFWYPVYVTLMEMILIVPLFLLAIILYNFALKRNRRVLTILASHLSFITGIFTFYIFIKVVYWLLPKKFLVNVFEYLASMKLLAIWNYILVIFGILLFGFLIFLSQKSLDKWKKIKEEQSKQAEALNKERIQKERFWAHKCIECNAKLLPDAEFCSTCGADQYQSCQFCEHRFPRAYQYCDKCGK